MAYGKVWDLGYASHRRAMLTSIYPSFSTAHQTTHADLTLYETLTEQVKDRKDHPRLEPASLTSYTPETLTRGSYKHIPAHEGGRLPSVIRSKAMCQHI